MYEYNKSIKSDVSDEFINTYLLRPVASGIVRLLYRTKVTPNQVTIASTIAGLAGALVYLRGDPAAVACAGLFVTAKDVLDSADGQLARSKQQYSRSGRFLDSIGDFIVSLAVFTAMGWMLSSRHADVGYGILALTGLAGLTFRVSYHVFYQTSFLHLNQQYQTNRVTEELREEDKGSDRLTLCLQIIFQGIYGWQDRMVLQIDQWCRGGKQTDISREKWFSDITGLRLAGLIGMGTELFLMTVCSLFDRLELYLYLNAVLMNALLLANILYRRTSLRQRIESLPELDSH